MLNVLNFQISKITSRKNPGGSQLEVHVAEAVLERVALVTVVMSVVP